MAMTRTTATPSSVGNMGFMILRIEREEKDSQSRQLITIFNCSASRNRSALVLCIRAPQRWMCPLAVARISCTVDGEQAGTFKMHLLAGAKPYWL